MGEQGHAGDGSVRFETIMARLRASTVVDDANARREAAAAKAQRVREFLEAQCAARRVPRAADVRRWVFAPEARGVVFDALAPKLAARGRPEDARWAFVVMVGPPGVGKTAALARAVARHEADALYVLAPDAARALQAGVRSFERDRAAHDLTERMRTVDLLAVDELGTEATDLSSELTALVGARCTDGLATLFASNLPTEEFRARYLSDRWRSRLNARGGATLVLQGPDLRRAT